MGYNQSKIAQCKKCGETFRMISPSQYVYHINKDYYCCYNCFIKDKKILLEKKNKKIEEELKGNK